MATPIRVSLVCDGQVSVNPDGFPMCSTGWLTQTAPVPFDFDHLDPQMCGLMIGLGFACVLGSWVGSRCVKAVLDTLRPHIRI